MTRRREQRSPEAQAYRKLYSIAAWRSKGGLREQALVRDGWQCRMCGQLLIGRKGDHNAPEVDHITDHKGDRALFLDLDNLQSLCTSCHSTHRQREAHGGCTVPIGADGWPAQ